LRFRFTPSRQAGRFCFLALASYRLRQGRFRPGMRQVPLDAYIYQTIYISTMAKIDPHAFIPLKTQWFHILLTLAGGEQHGYGIMQEVLQRTTGKVRLWPATLYGSIKRLIEAELIEESDERPAPELDDTRRRYYRLTRLGRRVLDLECERLQELVRAIQMKRGLKRGMVAE